MAQKEENPAVRRSEIEPLALRLRRNGNNGGIHYCASCASTQPLPRSTALRVGEPHNLWYTMDEIGRKLEAVFFKTDQGNEPVREWLPWEPRQF